LEAAIKYIPKLQSQLNALCNCKLRSSGGEVIAILLRGYMMIIKDSIILYTMLHDSMIQLVELFWKIEKTKASKILAMYKLYVRETNVLISIYNNVRNYFKELPTLKEADESMIESMEKYVANLEDDDDGNKVQEEMVPEDIPEELISTTPGSTYNGTVNQSFQNDQNSESEESSQGEDVDQETDDFFKMIITDFPNESIGFQQQQNNDPFSVFKPTSVPHSTATYEEKLLFIKSIPQNSISMTTQSLQSPNPFQTMLQPQTTNINPFSDMVNPFANVITNMTTSKMDQSLLPNPFTPTKIQSNPFL